MNTDKPEFTPKPGCDCAVCKWAKRRADRDADLADNYARYQRGELVSRDDSE